MVCIASTADRTYACTKSLILYEDALKKSLSRQHQVRPTMSRTSMTGTIEVEAPPENQAPHGARASHGTPRCAITTGNLDVSMLNWALKAKNEKAQRVNKDQTSLKRSIIEAQPL